MLKLLTADAGPSFPYFSNLLTPFWVKFLANLARHGLRVTRIERRFSGRRWDHHALMPELWHIERRLDEVTITLLSCGRMDGGQRAARPLVPCRQMNVRLLLSFIRVKDASWGVSVRDIEMEPLTRTNEPGKHGQLLRTFSVASNPTPPPPPCRISHSKQSWSESGVCLI